MSWINTISYESATGRLKKLYDRIKGPKGVLDNVLTIHSLRPHTLEAHMTLYKAVLHHSGNTLPKWYLELLGTYVSMINKCNYCATHHAVGFKRNLGSDEKYERLMSCLADGVYTNHLEGKYIAGIRYAKLLTIAAPDVNESHITSLRNANLTDGEILEINQVVGYFNYVNRMVVGLGIDLEESDIGLSPQSSDGDDWSHS
tara:strand:+ start:8 stop:610 length:603 start_codon:yes stop_codon:yes gene_type:complete